MAAFVSAGTIVTATAAPAAAEQISIPLVGLVDAAAQRLLTGDIVAAAKWHSNSPIVDRPRERQVLESVMALARRAGADPAFVAKVFRDQIDATTTIEHDLFARWIHDPESAPRQRPDLSEVRTTIDRLNRVMVEQLVAESATLSAPSCPLWLSAAQGVAALRNRLSPLHIRALRTATRSYCETR